ncbi:Solute carrier family 2, facilitated glucose transporter member 1 [Toxocara canis]|uniref:Solute carrier family 2, facilitated glucose transporter member 1 n=1 Tax=Toxocara canis TaxID=6265 RepID=A0A0B2V9I9_TOXCA|nr:Solute carrier family 2, facilitated glucose transporter member 1 [Toxocara canis]
MTSFLSATVFLAINVTGMGFGMDVVFGTNLPLLIGIGLIPGALAIIIMIPLAETPKYLLISRNDREAAMESLIFYRGESPRNEEIMEEILKESDEEHGMPLMEAIMKVFKTPHLRQAFILGVLIVQEAYSNSYPNTAIVTFQNYVNNSYISRGIEGGIPDGIYTWIWSAILNVWFLGYLLGVFLTPRCTDNYGRKTALLIANVLSVIGTVVSTVAVVFPVPELLFLGRIVSSISCGISFGTLILFLQETTPTELRGMTSFLSATVFLAINVTGMGFGMDVVFGTNLPLLIGIGLIPGALAIIIMIPLAETPKYLLISRNDREAAMESLIFYRGESPRNEEIMEEILKESDEEHGMPLMEAIMKVFKTPHLRQAFILGVLIVQVVVGIWPIIYLSTDFLSAHFSPTFAQVGSFVFIVADFLASIPGMFVVERFGRRPLLISFGILNTAALGPIAWFITSELAPQHFRSLIQSMVFSFNTVVNFTFVTLPIYRAINVWGFIPLFIIPSTLCLIYIYKYLPETKGHEIHEIIDKLKDRHNRKKSYPANSECSQETTHTISISSSVSDPSIFLAGMEKSNKNIPIISEEDCAGPRTLFALHA